MSGTHGTAGAGAEDWARVLAALGDPTWDFRTVKGIAKETGLEPSRVQRLIDDHPAEVRQSLSLNRRPIYTLSSRRPKLREILATIQRIITKDF